MLYPCGKRCYSQLKSIFNVDNMGVYSELNGTCWDAGRDL